MTTYLHYFTGNAYQGLTLLSALGVLFILSSIGGMIAGRNRTMEADVFIGWGAVTTVFTVAAVFTAGTLGMLTWALFAAGLVCAALLLRREKRLLAPGTGRVLLLLSPILLIAAAMEPSQWDEFSHWLSAPKSLFLSNDVPSADNLPQGTDMLVSYPYGWPYLTYLASRAVGVFMDGSGRIYNVVFLGLFGLIAAKVACRAAGHDRPARLTWRLAGLAALFGTVINPTFIQKIVLTAYADVSTAVVLGVAVYLLWTLLDAEAEGDRAKARQSAWQATFVMAALINIKQVNLILFLGLVISFLIAAWRAPDISLSRAVRLAVGIGILPLLVYGAWRYHVNVNIPGGGGGEATFMPFEQWNTHVIPQIMLQMLVVAGKKSAFFVVMAVTTIFAVRAFFRPSGRYGRLAILGGGTFVSYNTFLLFTYVASFGEKVALTAVSYWRYNTHLGMIAVLMIAVGAGWAWKRWDLENHLPKPITWLPVVLVVAAPFIFAHKLRFDLEPNKPHYFTVARGIISSVPKDMPLVIIDPLGSGESAIITRYITNRKGILFLSAFQGPTLPFILKTMADSKGKSWVLIHSVTPEMTRHFNGRFTNDSSYLLNWNEDHWRLVKEWPYPAVSGSSALIKAE